MKTLRYLKSTPLCILLFLSVIMSSCSKDDPSSSGQDGFTICANVDGIEVVSENAGVSLFSETTDFYIITSVGDHAFQFTLDGPAAEGTFTTGPEELLRLSYTSSNPTIIWGANELDGSGSITISQITDSFIRGTFSFTGINPADNTTIEISAGEFNAQKL